MTGIGTMTCLRTSGQYSWLAFLWQKSIRNYRQYPTKKSRRLLKAGGTSKMGPVFVIE